MQAMRTTPVEVGTKPYNWDSANVYQCTWYTYYRAGEKGLPYPCWWDRATQTGSYTNAKDWLENWRDPWEVKDIDYIPVENDIVVFDGTYGHVAFIEKVENGVAVLSQYKNGDKNSFSNYAWKIGTSYTGNLLGYLHCPIGIIEPVSRNEDVNQVRTTDDTLRIRTKPNLEGEIVGHVQLGYYNVLSTKDAIASDKAQVEGLECWYEITKDRWIANITTEYLPANSDADIIKELEKWAKEIKAQINVLKDENTELKSDMKQINEVVGKWV